MTNRENKLSEKQRDLERDSRRLMKQLTSAAMLDDCYDTVLIISRDGRYSHRGRSQS
jgi:hypothetical protein